MSDEKKDSRRYGKQRIKLPDGTWGVYMGETGGGHRRPSRPAGQRNTAPVRKKVQPQANGTARSPGQTAPATRTSQRGGIVSRYSLSPEERVEAERRKREIRERRSAANADIHKRLPQREPETVKFYHRILDRLHMWHLGISVNIENIIKGLVCGALIIVFAMLQITVFSKLRPFGAIPDLMLPLVIAIGFSEGERWGGVSGLAAAFLIECLGSAGVTLLPLLYVPCGFIAGVLGTYYIRDSFVIRLIFTLGAGILRAIVTVIYICINFKSPDASLMFGERVFPEFISTLVFSILPHITSWLSFKPFHKSRAERID